MVRICGHGSQCGKPKRLHGLTQVLCIHRLSTTSPTLVNAVLSLIHTTDRNLDQWSRANTHGSRMFEGVRALEDAAGDLEYAFILRFEAEKVFDVTHLALTGASKVIARDDDSCGIIGDVNRSLIDLHAHFAPDRL